MCAFSCNWQAPAGEQVAGGRGKRQLGGRGLKRRRGSPRISKADQTLSRSTGGVEREKGVAQASSRTWFASSQHRWAKAARRRDSTLPVFLGVWRFLLPIRYYSRGQIGLLGLQPAIVYTKGLQLYAFTAKQKSSILHRSYGRSAHKSVVQFYNSVVVRIFPLYWRHVVLLGLPIWRGGKDSRRFLQKTKVGRQIGETIQSLLLGCQENNSPCPCDYETAADMIPGCCISETSHSSMNSARVKICTPSSSFTLTFISVPESL